MTLDSSDSSNSWKEKASTPLPLGDISKCVSRGGASAIADPVNHLDGQELFSDLLLNTEKPLFPDCSDDIEPLKYDKCTLV